MPQDSAPVTPPPLKPSTSFSSTSSAASATTAGTPRSGCSRLLFGEIDTSSERSDSNVSVCSLVQFQSSTLLRFWLNDDCRDGLISLLPASDLANLRLVCHDFAERAAPALFSELNITFRPYTFTKPSRQAALHRLGFHVKILTFHLPHSRDTFLPPIVEPDTGDELSYTYIPRIQPLAIRQPRYGDWETTEILTRQYPPLFHAATNVDAFIQAFSAFVNLEHLKISCPGYESVNKSRRSAVDYALISLRIAIERNRLNALDSLTLSPIHPAGLRSLSPLLGLGASPISMRRWSSIKHLTVHAALHQDTKLLPAYFSTFQRSLRSLNFRWIDHKGPLPLVPQRPSSSHPALSEPINATAAHPVRRRQQHLYFPQMQRLEIENITASATEISAVLALHKRTLADIDIRATDLTEGTWDQAFAPLTKVAAKSQAAVTEMADIPIMLSPTTAFPRPMERTEIVQTVSDGGRSLRASRWLGGRKVGGARTPLLPAIGLGKVKHGIMDCESKVKKALKGAVLPWM